MLLLLFVLFYHFMLSGVCYEAQDAEILSLQGLFNPAPAHKNSHQD